MLADRRLAENIAKRGVWQTLVVDSIAKHYDVSVQGRAQPEHDNTLRQLTGRGTKSKARKAISHTTKTAQTKAKAYVLQMLLARHVAKRNV